MNKLLNINNLKNIFQFIKSKINQHPTLSLFLISMALYLFAGLFLTYDFEFISETFNTFFGSDTARAFGDMVNRDYNHYRIEVHPLMLILIQPITSILKVFSHKSTLVVSILQAATASANVCLLYSILKKLNIKKEVSIICTVLFGICFSTVLFSAIPETYVFSAFTQLLFWNYIIILKQQGKTPTFINLLTLTLLGIMSIGIILSNIVYVLIGILYFINEVYKKDLKSKFINGAIIISMLLTILTILAKIQSSSFPATPFFVDNIKSWIFHTSPYSEFMYFNLDFSLEKLSEVMYQILIMPVSLIQYYVFYTEESIYLPGLVANCTPSIHNIIILFVLYFLPLIVLLKNIRNNANTNLVLYLLAILVINYLSAFFYSSAECFIYSQNYLFIVFILLGIALNEIKNNKFMSVYRIFLQYILLINIIALIIMKHSVAIITLIYENNLLHYCIISLLTVFYILLIILSVRKMLNEKLLNLSTTQVYPLMTIGYFAFIILFVLTNNLN